MNSEHTIIVIGFFVLIFICHFASDYIKMCRLRSEMNYLMSSENSHEILLFSHKTSNDNIDVDTYHTIHKDYINYLTKWYAETDSSRNKGLYNISKKNKGKAFFAVTFCIFLDEFMSHPHNIPYNDTESYKRYKDTLSSLYELAAQLKRNV